MRHRIGWEAAMGMGRGMNKQNEMVNSLKVKENECLLALCRASWNR
jgi:hypothetical protein